MLTRMLQLKFKFILILFWKSKLFYCFRTGYLTCMQNIILLFKSFKSKLFYSFRTGCLNCTYDIKLQFKIKVVLQFENRLLKAWVKHNITAKTNCHGGVKKIFEQEL